MTLRYFAQQCRDPASISPGWRDGFHAAGIDDCGVPAFDGLFSIGAAAALHPLDVRCPRCRFLGKDERLFLQLVSFLQYRQIGEAGQILTGWLPPAAAQMAMLPALARISHTGLVFGRR
ncbi:MAG TPA: hypothetical protein VJX94_10795 [Stellaceae bacterium]|nr:hypothetical protein [Stellaceae bacterium]